MLEFGAMAVVRFGVFDFDSDTNELHRLGRRVHLTAQASKVLALLVSRPGDIVTRDELKRHLWDPDTFVDFDHSLNFCIASVRAALHDDARNPQFIETIPRRGYRFMAEVRAVDQPSPIEPIHAPPPSSGSPVARWLVGFVAAAVLSAQQPMAPSTHSRDTASPEARAAFAQAFEAVPQDAAALRRSVARLKRATDLDARFAEAHFALADLYVKLALRHELPLATALAEAENAARHAIALEDVPETRQVLANLRLLRDWDWAGARREMARAVALAPSWDIGLATYARVLSAAGDDQAAIAAINRAETLSPTCDLILYDAGAIYARAGRFAEADQKLRRAIDMGPPHSMTKDQWRAEVQFRRLRFAVARGDWRRAHEAAIAIVSANGYGAEIERRFADQEPRAAVAAFLRRSLANTTTQAAKEYVAPTRMATFFALLHEPERAMDWLNAAAAERDPDLIYVLRDPEYEYMRVMPGFAALAERVHGQARTGAN